MSVVVKYRIEGLEIPTPKAGLLRKHHNKRSRRECYTQFDLEGMLGPFKQAAVVLIDKEEVIVEATDDQDRTWTLARPEGMGWWIAPTPDYLEPGEGGVQPMRFHVFESGCEVKLRIESAPKEMVKLTVIGLSIHDVMLYSLAEK